MTDEADHEERERATVTRNMRVASERPHERNEPDDAGHPLMEQHAEQESEPADDKALEARERTEAARAIELPDGDPFEAMPFVSAVREISHEGRKGGSIQESIR